MKKLIGVVLALFVVGQSHALDSHKEPTQTALHTPGSLANIDAHFQPLVDSGHYRGLTILVAQKGEIVYLKGFGKRGTDDSVESGTDSIYQIFSMTKPVTSVALMMLWEEGKFKLDDPITKYLPEYKQTPVYVSGDASNMTSRPVENPITVRHLMTHTEGMGYVWGEHPVNKAYIDVGLLNPAVPLADFSQTLAKIPLIHEPGERFNYGVSVDVQARLVEVLSGQSFRAFLKSRLLDPLKMTDTDFWVPKDKWQRFARLYDRNEDGALQPGDEATWKSHAQLPALTPGGHGLVSTASDYWRFAQMLLNNGTFEGKRYLKTATVELMRENHLPASSPWQIWPPAGPSFGRGMGLNLGVVLDTEQDTVNYQVGEYGWNGAASTIYWNDPENELVVIGLTSIMPYEADPIINALHDAIHGPKPKT